jgi:hypothetical protein
MKTFVENLELNHMMFVADLVRRRKVSDTKISVKKKLHDKPERMVLVKIMMKIKGNKEHMQSSNFQR